MRWLLQRAWRHGRCDRPQGAPLTRTLVGPGLPVWSWAFLPDSRHVLRAALKHHRRWNAADGEPVESDSAGDAGSPLAAYAAIAARRSFAPVSPAIRLARAGQPAQATLAGIFGRRIAPHRVIIFPKVTQRLDIVWTPDTVANCSNRTAGLYAGTKMPSSASARSRTAPRWCNFRARDRRILSAGAATIPVSSMLPGVEKHRTYPRNSSIGKPGYACGGGDFFDNATRWLRVERSAEMIECERNVVRQRAGRLPRNPKSTDASWKTPLARSAVWLAPPH